MFLSFPELKRIIVESSVPHLFTCVLLIASIVGSPGVLRAQDSLTVEQVLFRALKTHPAIDQAVINSGAAEERVRSTESALYPDISLQASYANIGPLVELTIPHMGSIQFYPQNNYDAHLAARYTVTDFGRTGAMVALGRSRARSSRDVVELTQTGVAIAAVRTFYAILFLHKSLQVQDEQIEALSGHLEAVQKRVQAGTATHFDMLTTQVRVAAAQNQKADIENALQKQEAVLRQLLNVPPGSSVPIRGSWQLIPAGLNNDSLFQTASHQRIELIMAHDAEETAKWQLRWSSLGSMPALRMNLQYGTKNGYIPDLKEMRTNWVASIGVEMPLFTGGRISHQTEEAKVLLLAEQAHTRDVENQIRTEVEQASFDVQTALEKIDISRIQLDQAREAVSMARTRYESGTATNLDLLDAELAESMAKLANLQAMYRYVVSRYELDRVVGNRFWAH
jgi:outer membrane protein